jgi:hypothetical protein
MKAKAEIRYPTGKIYPPVSFDGLNEEHMRPVLSIVRDVYKDHGIECVVTAGTEAFRLDVHNGLVSFIHSIDSLHPFGLALDFSLRGVKKIIAVQVQVEIQKRLDEISEWYDVVLHDSHIHIEYDRKTNLKCKVCGK